MIKRKKYDKNSTFYDELKKKNFFCLKFDTTTTTYL
jgi:hypothetical protein